MVEQHMKLQEAAKRADTSPKTLRRWLKADGHALPRPLRIPESVLAAMLARRSPQLSKIYCR